MPDISSKDIFKQNPAKKVLIFSSIIFLLSIIALLVIESDSNLFKWIVSISLIFSGAFTIVALNEVLNIFVFKNYEIRAMDIDEAIKQKAFARAIAQVNDLKEKGEKEVVCAIRDKIIIAAFASEEKITFLPSKKAVNVK